MPLFIELPRGPFPRNATTLCELPLSRGWVYADDAEWIEYKPSAPPRNPLRMVGRKRIAEFLASLEKSDIKISLSNEVLGRECPAFSVDVTLPDGKRVFEHTIVHIEDGKIARQVDVEAWD